MIASNIATVNTHRTIAMRLCECESLQIDVNCRLADLRQQMKNLVTSSEDQCSVKRSNRVRFKCFDLIDDDDDV